MIIDYIARLKSSYSYVLSCQMAKYLLGFPIITCYDFGAADIRTHKATVFCELEALVHKRVTITELYIAMPLAICA